MWQIVFHQLFWGFISFFMFFILIKQFVIRNVMQIEEKRNDHTQKLNLQIKAIIEKSQLLQNVAKKIVNEEVPEKQRLYIEKKIEPILYELKMIELNEQQMLQDKLVGHNILSFKEKIASQEHIHDKLEEFAEQLMGKLYAKIDIKRKEHGKENS